MMVYIEEAELPNDALWIPKPIDKLRILAK